MDGKKKGQEKIRLDTYHLRCKIPSTTQKETEKQKERKMMKKPYHALFTQIKEKSPGAPF